MIKALETKMKILAHFSLDSGSTLKKILDFGTLKIYMKVYTEDLAKSENLSVFYPQRFKDLT
jgi:hypothetical protein